MIELFGYRFGKIQDEKNTAEQIPSFTPPPNLDGSLEIAPGGSYGTFVDLEGTAKNEAELVTKYRDIALQAEADTAIDEIVNEVIVREDNKASVEINLDKLNISDKIKDKIRSEFDTILSLLDFNNTSYDIFRHWYVDGRIYYHMMIDEKRARTGIQELRYIDPRRIHKVREPLRKEKINSQLDAMIAPAFNEYFLYTPASYAGGAVGGGVMTQGIKISKDSVAYVHSGVMDQRNRMILSHLHKAIKPMNQLRMLEDAAVIYRLARAPERRIFYIDVGDLPKMKAEQYLRDMMLKHKNRLVYNADTGEIKDDRKFMTMLEDFWLPRRGGTRGTEITTLPGGQNLSELADVEYFRSKLYKALQVPITRIQSDNNFSLGRVGEITRDEVKFSKLVDRLRTRFSQLFDVVLETQLILRGIITRDEWKDIKEYIHYDYLRDNYFAEIKDQEIISARIGVLQNVDNHVGKYFSQSYVRKTILRMTDEDIKQINDEISVESRAAPAENLPNEEPPKEEIPTPKLEPEPEPEQEVTEAAGIALTEEENMLIKNMSSILNTAFEEEENAELPELVVGVDALDRGEFTEITDADLDAALDADVEQKTSKQYVKHR